MIRKSTGFHQRENYSTYCFSVGKGEPASLGVAFQRGGFIFQVTFWVNLISPFKFVVACHVRSLPRPEISSFGSKGINFFLILLVKHGFLLANDLSQFL